ncbi:MAG: AAA family ATPase [Verrucomicrobiae bacterium]|nr:AAA family ATPase [Verrucomicrobiae bacterium]
MIPPDRSVFLWGPRRTGKSFWLREQFAAVPWIDLLQTEVFAEYAARPQLLRERAVSEVWRQGSQTIVVDEVQKVPALLDEVHWLIENLGLRFVLTGSSARKLRRGHANLLAGRAWRREMRPLCFGELWPASPPSGWTGFSVERCVLTGMLPAHVLRIIRWRNSAPTSPATCAKRSPARPSSGTSPASPSSFAWPPSRPRSCSTVPMSPAKPAFPPRWCGDTSRSWRTPCWDSGWRRGLEATIGG